MVPAGMVFSHNQNETRISLVGLVLKTRQPQDIMAMDGCNTKFVVVCVSLAVLFYSALCDTPTKPKVYKVNLDLPEEDRWVHVVQDFSGLVPLMNKIIK